MAILDQIFQFFSQSDIRDKFGTNEVSREVVMDARCEKNNLFFYLELPLPVYGCCVKSVYEQTFQK